MKNRSALITLGTFSTLAALSATGCMPGTADRVQAVAASRNIVVVSATATATGGCGDGLSGTPVEMVSTDSGATFTRIDITNEQTSISNLVVKDGVFYGLRAAPYAGAFAVQSSTDGITWTTLTTGNDDASDMILDAGGFHIAHQQGVLTSPDGITWTDHAVSQVGIDTGRITSVDNLLVIASQGGTVSTSPDGATWTVPEPLANQQYIYQIAASQGHAIAIADGEDYNRHLVSFAPSGIDAPTVTTLDDSITALLDTPAGLLVGDGTIVRDAASVATRAAHTDAFVAGAVDGQRVILADETSIRISLDGGEHFTQSASLPVNDSSL